jgi:RNA polymerase sigma-70 factor, ECF subfamily
MQGAPHAALTPKEPQSRADAQAWKRVYADHFPLVWRSLRRLGVPEAVLDDAVQDVFLVVFRRWSEFAQRSSLKTWVYGILLRVAHDYRRSARRHAARIQRFSQAAQTEPARRSPEFEAELLEANRLLHSLLDGLDEEERAAFVLVELEQLPVREAQSVMGLSRATCQRRLRAARDRFNRALQRHLDSQRRPSR